MTVEFQKIKIDGIEYFIIDSIQDFRAEDSFIHRTNKLAQFRGNGESKKYIGSYTGDYGVKITEFFNYTNWGTEYIDIERNRKTETAARINNAIVQDQRCFFSKTNMLKYLDDAKAEYCTQEQIYHKDISVYFDRRYQSVDTLPSEYIYFTIYDASDGLNQQQSRAYIRSDNEIWKLWRELILPKISYLSILKLVPVNQVDSLPVFYFRILLDYQFRSFVHPSCTVLAPGEADINPEEAEKLIVKYRKGQEKYRREVIEYMPQCPFTKISDERLLTASHIKPYNVCMKEKREDHALDYLNGLTLTPTYDRLFDQGYITFKNDGELVCGTQLSSYTWA
ncbi:MAG: HNH endonuclease, partial [Erysipelotrichales bacterium]|nr:HNH endonuclease [Erysipelotrichales bacterium]